ncbi:MAG: hypothetical protein HONBIEJF_00246 [Fimbriimonadaceae bacterium]|nr:hypothetical protein [Fimbriimonadaceae bacterium]
MAFRNRLEELESAIRRIPPGRVANYGEIGRMLERPLSGLLVGRMIRSASLDAPWWRVVGADGRLPLDKRGPEFGADQRQLLADEGVAMVEDRIPASFFWFAGENS